MQVDCTNFQAVLPQILAHIKQADFVAFDCQFTGLVTKLEKIEGIFSNHIEFYERIKETSYNFRIIQLGLAIFVFKQGLYKPFVYNIFIRPDTFTRGYNNVMICQLESMEFLAKNKLDFNRVFCRGISTRRLGSSDIEQKHQYNQLNSISVDNMFLSPQEEQYSKEIQESVIVQIKQNWKIEKIVDFKNKTLFTYFRQKYPDMIIDKSKKNMKAFQYSLRFRKEAKIEYNKNTKIEQPSQICTKIEQPSQICEKKQILQTQDKIDKQEPKIQEIKEKQIKQSEAVFEKPCLSKIFSTIIQGRKPLVGHFPNLDIGLLYHTFISDLPDSYFQFCYHLNQYFPELYDTKILSRRLQSRLKGLKVDLPSLFKACTNPKLLKPYSNFDLSGLQQYVQKEHEAGYDAFITGCSFIGMANFLSGKVGKINNKWLEEQNKLLYSRFSGEVSVNGNGYCSNATNYDQTIIIESIKKSQNPNWEQIAKALSKFGSLIVYEDRDETYYVFEEPKNILQIITFFPTLQLKTYPQRKIIQARNMYKQFPHIMI